MRMVTDSLDEIYAYIVFLCQKIGLPVPEVKEAEPTLPALGEYERFIIRLKRPYDYEIATHEWLHYAFDMMRLVGDEQGDDTLEHRFINVVVDILARHFRSEFEKVYKLLMETKKRR